MKNNTPTMAEKLAYHHKLIQTIDLEIDKLQESVGDDFRWQDYFAMFNEKVVEKYGRCGKHKELATSFAFGARCVRRIKVVC